MMLPSFAAERQHASSATPTVHPQLFDQYLLRAGRSAANPPAAAAAAVD